MQRSFLSIVILLWVQAYLFGPELLKLPVFIGHYLEHCEEDQDLAFGDFVAMHYANEEHAENGESDHESMPFHHHHGTSLDCCGAPLYFAAAHGEVTLLGGTPAPLCAMHNADDLLPGHTRGLIMPPRMLA